MNFPELAHLRLPVYVAVLVGLVPLVVAVRVVFDLLGVVDQGEAFSARTVRLLRRLKVLFGITVAYLVLGVVGVSVAFGQTHPGIRSNLKTGKARAIRFTTLEAICDVLDCQPGDLIEYRPSQDPAALGTAGASPATTVRDSRLAKRRRGR